MSRSDAGATNCSPPVGAIMATERPFDPFAGFIPTPIAVTAETLPWLLVAVSV
jgi:hypothetical protein